MSTLYGDDSATIVLVLDCDLGLGVGSYPWNSAVISGIGHGLVELVGEEEGQRARYSGVSSVA